MTFYPQKKNKIKQTVFFPLKNTRSNSSTSKKKIYTYKDAVLIVSVIFVKAMHIVPTDVKQDIGELLVIRYAPPVVIRTVSNKTEVDITAQLITVP